MRSAGNRVVVEEARKTTTISLSTRMNFIVREPIRLKSDSPFLRNAHTDGHTQTDRHLCFIYVDVAMINISTMPNRTGYFFMLKALFPKKRLVVASADMLNKCVTGLEVNRRTT